LVANTWRRFWAGVEGWNSVLQLTGRLAHWHSLPDNMEHFVTLDLDHLVVLKVYHLIAIGIGQLVTLKIVY
jgi:hypothetical protein